MSVFDFHSRKHELATALMSCYNFFLSFFYRILANFFSLKLTIAALPPFIMLLRRPRHLEVARWVLLLHEALSLVHQIFSSHLIRPVSSFFKWKIFALISLYLRLFFFSNWRCSSMFPMHNSSSVAQYQLHHLCKILPLLFLPWGILAWQVTVIPITFIVSCLAK